MPPARPPHPDDNLMERFDRSGVRRFCARDAVLAVLIATVVLVLCSGASVKKQAEEMAPGIGRSLILAVGHPTSWIADRLPFHSAADSLTGWLSPNPSLTGSGFVSLRSTTGQSGIPPVTPDSFDPRRIGAPAPPRRSLRTLLVTGDSMSMPLDQDLAQRLDPEGVKVIQDPHVGTGISNTLLVDWGRLSASQVRRDQPDAVVVFIGANDGYSMPGAGGGQVSCCGAQWAAIYANRVRQMMNTYRRAGAARVYWLTLPTPRDPARKRIATVVNAAIEVAAEPWLDQVHVLDMVPVFTPGNVYRDSMTVGGQPTIVRQSDGIHLNDAGSALAARIVLGAIDQEFTH